MLMHEYTYTSHIHVTPLLKILAMGLQRYCRKVTFGFIGPACLVLAGMLFLFQSRGNNRKYRYVRGQSSLAWSWVEKAEKAIPSL